MANYQHDRRLAERGEDRRQRQRIPAQYEARLSVGMTILNADLDVDDPPMLNLRGYTRDLSHSGLAVIVPSVSMDGRACIERYPLHITLLIPDAPVEMEAETVHCEPLHKREPGRGYLIGASVKQIGEDEAGYLARSLNVDKGRSRKSEASSKPKAEKAAKKRGKK